MQTKTRVTPTPLTLCLLHLEYHHMGAACLENALEFVHRHADLTSDEIYDAYHSAAEQMLLDRWHRTQIL